MVCYLIDDDHDDQEFFAMALEQIDRKVQLMTSDNALDALEKLREPGMIPDLIFLDINMPRIDGWQCLKQLREIERLKKTPIVIYSTSKNGHARQDKQGFNAFLSKQPRITELSRKLEELFIEINV